MSPIRNKRVLHGRTRTAYLRGCRCDKCRKAESDYQRARRQAKKAVRAQASPTTEETDATYGHLVPDSEDYLRGLLDAYDVRKDESAQEA